MSSFISHRPHALYRPAHAGRCALLGDPWSLGADWGLRSDAVSKLGLQAITVIPQDPLLMEGTVAQNLDPFGRWSPDEIELALRKASLDPALASYQVTKSGMNLSSGERQLVCFARALLFRAKILVLVQILQILT